MILPDWVDFVMTPLQLSAWPDTRIIRKLTGGFRNEVYLVERDGMRYVAKTTRRTGAALEWLEPVHKAARDAGLVVPEFIKTPQGTVLAHGVTLETFVAGVPIAETDLPLLSAYINKFHTLTKNLPQRPGFASAVNLLQITKGGDVDLKKMPPALVAACRAAWQGLVDEPHCAVHADLNPSNVLRIPNGRFALIDWDEARLDAALFDMDLLLGPSKPVRRALLAWEVACSWELEPQHARKVARLLV